MRSERFAKGGSRFQAVMAVVWLLLLAIALIGCRLTHIEVKGLAGVAVAVAVLSVVMLPLPVYWHQKSRFERRDAALVLYWTVLCVVMLPYPVMTAARMHGELCDPAMLAADRALGVSVPALMAWAVRHSWLNAALNLSYAGLLPMLLAAIFLPSLTGRRNRAQRFLLANAIAFLAGVLLFGIFPVVGPWAGYRFAPSAAQEHTVQVFMALRGAGSFSFFPGTDLGIISFPSFHVIWALLSAEALFEFRRLRIPAAVLAGMICLSTMTTGWHYFADVLAGAAIAFVASRAARKVLDEALPSRLRGEVLETVIEDSSLGVMVAEVNSYRSARAEPR